MERARAGGRTLNDISIPRAALQLYKLQHHYCIIPVSTSCDSPRKFHNYMSELRSSLAENNLIKETRMLLIGTSVGLKFRAITSERFHLVKHVERRKELQEDRSLKITTIQEMSRAHASQL